ncbi:MAG: efflux RND transporter periplasmic adaptor subunit, partial [Nitratireductor sp.]
MKFKNSGSILIAILLAVGVGVWMYTGDIVIGGQSETGDAAVPIASREAEKDTQLFKVRYVSVNSQVRQDFVTIRGRTKADAIITLRAETSGILE